MKKICLFLLVSVFSFAVFSQTVVKTTLNTSTVEQNYFKYTGSAADTLNASLDSIQFPIKVTQNFTYKIDLSANFNKRSGADTLIIMTLYGKKFEDEASWTRLTSGHSANVTGAIQSTLSYGTAVQYRYLKVVFQIAGTKSTGVKITKWELKLWNQ